MMSSLTLPIPTIPFMRKWGHLPDNYEALYQEMIDAMQQPGYVASWSLMTAWGTKTSQPL